MMEYEYAKEFGCHPQDVQEVVTVEAWQRWLLWKKAQNSREVYEQSRQSGAVMSFTPEQRRLFDWPVMDGEY